MSAKNQLSAQDMIAEGMTEYQEEVTEAMYWFEEIEESREEFYGQMEYPVSNNEADHHESFWDADDWYISSYEYHMDLC